MNAQYIAFILPKIQLIKTMLMRSIIVSFVCYGYAQSCILCLIVYIFNKIKAITTLSNVLKKTTFHKK